MAGACRLVIVHRARNRAGRENPRIVAAADDDADAALGAARELALEHLLFEQRVAHGDEEEVDVEEVEIARDRPHRVEACADPLDHALVAQRAQRPPAAGDELAEIGVDRGRVLVMPARRDRG